MDIKFSVDVEGKYRTEILDILYVQLENLEMGKVEKSQRKPIDDTLAIDFETLNVYYQGVKLAIDVYKAIKFLVEESRRRVAVNNKISIEEVPKVRIEIDKDGEVISGLLPGSDGKVRGIIEDIDGVDLEEESDQ